MSDFMAFGELTPSAATPQAGAQRPLSVTELTQKIRRLLETQVADVLVEGEVSGYKGASSGHIYFDLKDSGALIKCVIWAADAARLRMRPTDGMKLEARGRLTVYDQRGQYQLRVITIRPAGLGKLYQAFIEMKERLAEEGLFDEGRKRPLPPHPRLIGLVTSPTGAAIRDMLNILTRRAPHIHVLIWPAKVQGEGASREVAYGINRLNALTPKPDVLIVGRGGGSLEDLWAFNEEVVARAIYQSAIPVISAVGHETDTTIADFVADLRAPTPSAAAELVAKDSGEVLKHLTQLQNRAYRAMKEHMGFLREAQHLSSRIESAVLPRLQMYRASLDRFYSSYSVQLPQQRINQGRQRHDDLLDRLQKALTTKLSGHQVLAQNYSTQLRNLNPRSILKRGYSITYNRDTNAIICAAKEAPTGTPLQIILGNGQISAVAGTAGASARNKTSRRKASTSPTLDWFGTETQDGNPTDE